MHSSLEIMSSNEESSTQPKDTSRPGVRCCSKAVLYAALLSNGLNIGLNVGILGPSLPDLALQTSSSIPDMSLVFITSSIAYMLGSLACGFMLGRLDGYLVISLTLILQALSTLVAPWCKDLALMSAFISLAYFFSTVVIGGTAYLCFRLEKSEARRVTQIVFTLFNLGKALVPFIVAPFLTQESAGSGSDSISSTDNSRHSQIRLSGINLQNASYNGNGSTISSLGYPSSIGYGYAIVAIYSLVMSALYGYISFFQRGCSFWASEEERQYNKDMAKTSPDNAPLDGGVWRKCLIIGLFFLMNLIQCGMESVDAGLLMTFLTEYLGRSKTMGVIASGVYQGTKVIACIIVVLTVRYIFPSVLLLIDYLIILSATILMTIAIAFEVHDALLWITFVLLALGISNTYATIASWLSTRYAITGKITGILTISFGLGSMIFPVLTTNLLEAKGPIMFPVVLLAGISVTIITYFFTKIAMGEKCCPKSDIREVEIIHDYENLIYNETDVLLTKST